MSAERSKAPNADQSDIDQVYTPPELLPEPLPGDPMPTVVRWFAEARQAKDQPNTNAMTLATVDPEGAVSARIVLCKDLNEAEGRLTFYTNRNGRKGRALEANPRAAVVFHWDHADRQVRIEGPVTHAPEEESDAYFASRPWESKVGAWASDQTEPIGSRAELIAKVDAKVREFGLDPAQLEPGDRSVQIPRPPHWGGYRLWAERVEVWLGGPGRVHDRAVWRREVAISASGTPECGGWTVQRLQP